MPSVVVLPFKNLSDDPEQEYFADGITEDVTTDLVGIPWIFVISRSSAFTYKGSPVNVAEVSRELGVRYVVEGSVRKVGERVRVTAQLIDAIRDVHVWSDRYDRDLGDLLDLQSEISEQILGALGVEIHEAEFARLRRKPTRSLSAYEAFIRGLGTLEEDDPRGLRRGTLALRACHRVGPGVRGGLRFPRSDLSCGRAFRPMPVRHQAASPSPGTGRSGSRARPLRAHGPFCPGGPGAGRRAKGRRGGCRRAGGGART